MLDSTRSLSAMFWKDGNALHQVAGSALLKIIKNNRAEGPECTQRSFLNFYNLPHTRSGVRGIPKALCSRSTVHSALAHRSRSIYQVLLAVALSAQGRDLPSPHGAVKIASVPFAAI
jgi:hypothetical protein